MGNIELKGHLFFVGLIEGEMVSGVPFDGKYPIFHFRTRKVVGGDHPAASGVVQQQAVKEFPALGIPIELPLGGGHLEETHSRRPVDRRSRVAQSLGFR